MYNSIEVSDNLTEVKFLEQFILNLCSGDIVCNTSFTNLETAYTNAETETSAEPSFEISIGNSFSLIFSHPKTSGTFSDGLTVKLKKFDESSSNYTILTTHLKLGSNIDTTPGTSADRKLYFVLAKNSNFISLMVGSYNTALNSSWDFDLCFLLDEGYNGYSAAYNSSSPYTTSTPAINNNFYFKSNSNLISTTVYDRMNYGFLADKTLEYANSKVFLDSNNKVYYTTTSIIDSSTIEGTHKHIIMNDSEYYSLNTKTLITV